MAKNSLKNVGGTERSAYFARREAANVLRCVLKGDAERRAAASIKSLVYKPFVRNKKATFALVCQTLKYLPILKKVLADTNLMSCKWKRQAELIYVITYDIMFGQDAVSAGNAENFVRSQKNSLRTALARICMKENVKSPQDLLPKDNQGIGLPKPRYVRVNTLKVDMDYALQTLQKTTQVKQDDLISDLLVLPAGADMHNHPLVLNGNLFLQGKASCMPAVALCPHPDWEVLDACAAPGNKTIQLAGLMKGRGKIFACELNGQRLTRLRETVKLSGASNVEILHTDFLKLRPNASKFSKVRAILLDPSCSGSGTTLQRLDHLLPSHAAGHGKDTAEVKRINNLATFQKKALLHALSFPTVERVVYSTCSIHQMENEDVISSVLPHAHALNFHLEPPFPEWAHRGLPVFGGAKQLLRTEGARDMEGFFIALFVRRREKIEHLDSSENYTHIISAGDQIETPTCHPKLVSRKKYKALMTKERPAKFYVEEDSVLALREFDILHVKPKLPSKKICLKGTMNMHKRSILNGVIKKGFGTPKMLRLLYIINCNKMRRKKRKMQKKGDIFTRNFRKPSGVK